eukprot:3281079-Pyramimonas_sp.AAC.1
MAAEGVVPGKRVVAQRALVRAHLLDCVWVPDRLPPALEYRAAVDACVARHMCYKRSTRSNNLPTILPIGRSTNSAGVDVGARFFPKSGHHPGTLAQSPPAM